MLTSGLHDTSDLLSVATTSSTHPAPSAVNEDQQAATRVRTDALQDAIFNSANFSSIATDAQGVIQMFNVGACLP